MTNAEWISSRPEVTAGEIIAAAEEWYAGTHMQADTATASLIGKLTAWITAEHTEPTARREVTVVTTVEVTHILRGLDDSEVMHGGMAQRIAETVRRRTERALRSTPELAADHVGIAKVQVFGLTQGAGARAEEAQG